MSLIYSEATTNAEVRTWATLPKTISVLRMSVNKSGLIDLRSSGNVLTSVSVPTHDNSIVYVRVAPQTWDIKVMKLK